jgi:anti-anti-sigma factor
VVSEPTGFRLFLEPTRAVLAVFGPLDDLSGPTFEQLVNRCLDGAGRVQELVVDLAASPFITAAGFRALLQSSSRASEVGCRVCVEHLSPLVGSMVGVLGLAAVCC